MSEKQKGNGFALDDDVKAEVEKASAESDLMGSWVTDEQGGDKLPLVEGWLPDNDEWQGKTVVNDREARLFALARALPYAYREEFQEMDGDMNGFITTLFTNLEMYLTSRVSDKNHTNAREQQMQVLRAMFGGGSLDDDSGNFMRGVFAQAGEDDE